MKKVIMVLFLVTVIFGLAACGGTAEYQDSPTQTTVNEQNDVENVAAEVRSFPFAFTTTNVDNTEVTHEDLGEKEIFFIYLWATNCRLCIETMPVLAELEEIHGDSVGFLGILTESDFNRSQQDAARIVEESGVQFINISASTPGLETVMELLLSGFAGIPSSIILDGNGRVVGQRAVGSPQQGYAGFIEEALYAVRR